LFQESSGQCGKGDGIAGVDNRRQARTIAGQQPVIPARAVVDRINRVDAGYLGGLVLEGGAIISHQFPTRAADQPIMAIPGDGPDSVRPKIRCPVRIVGQICKGTRGIYAKIPVRAADQPGIARRIETHGIS
jgi:hypothetical protein